MTSSRSPELVEVLRAAVEAGLQDLHTALPAKVEKYDAAKQKVDVKPLLKRNVQLDDGTELLEELPVITNVPVVFPRSTGFKLTFPIAAGDHVLLVFIERSIDQFMEKGDDTDPVDFRTHHLADAVAIPGFYPTPVKLKEADVDNMVIGHDGGMELHITPEDTAEFRVGGTADVSVCIAETLQTFWDSQVKPLFDAFDAHVHPTGVGPSGPPAPVVALPAMDAAIISANVKLKDN